MSGEGALPQSNALSAASSESLSDLMSRDPEGFQAQDLARIVAAFREQRARWEAMEASEEATGKVKKEKTKADASVLLKKASGNVGDLGL